jgi:DNA-binding SARP family transcriptional activator
MKTLYARLFGQFMLYREEHAPIELSSPRMQELLCYVLLKRHQIVPRDALIDVFWQTSTASQARRNLRQALWHLQHTLQGVGFPQQDPLMLTTAGCVRVNPTWEIQTDVGVFERTFEQVRGVPAERLSDQQVRLLQGAIELYGGELLHGWYQEWCLAERDRLQACYLAMLDKLIARCELQCAYEDGLGYGERALHYDRSSERTHRRMMRLLYRAGDRAAALHQYDRCVAALREDLEVEPSPATTELYHQIRSGALLLSEQHTPAQSPFDAPDASSASLMEIHERLTQLWRTTLAIQMQLQDDMETVQRLLGEQR